LAAYFSDSAQLHSSAAPQENVQKSVPKLAQECDWLAMGQCPETWTVGCKLTKCIFSFVLILW